MSKTDRRIRRQETASNTAFKNRKALPVNEVDTKDLELAHGMEQFRLDAASYIQLSNTEYIPDLSPMEFYGTQEVYSYEQMITDMVIEEVQSYKRYSVEELGGELNHDTPLEGDEEYVPSLSAIGMHITSRP
jgi:hypothetical protein